MQPRRSGSHVSGPTRGRGATTWIATAMLVGALAWVARDNFSVGPGAGAAEVVRPVGEKDLDPEVRELIEAKLARVEADPSDGALHGDLGLVYEANELWDLAALSLANAARLDPEEPLWGFHEGIAAQRTGDDARALELFAEVAAKLPSEVGVQHRYAYALLDAGQLDQAERAFERVARLVPDRPESGVGLAEVSLERGDHARAVQRLEAALRHAEAPRAAHYSLGLAYRGLGRLEEAERELLIGQGAERRHIGDRLYGRVEDYAVYYAISIDRASDLLNAGQPAAAARKLEGLFAHRPDDTNLMNNLAIAYLRQGQVERADELLARALEVDGEAFATHQNLAACALAAQDLDRALRHAERAVAIAPGVASTHGALVQVLATAGRFEEAYASAVRAAELDPADVNGLLVAAELCMRLARYREARQRFEGIVELAPRYLPAHLNLVAATVALGDLDAARRALAAAEALEPDHPRVRAAREMVAQASGG